MDERIKIAIVRPDANSVSSDFYNSQEIGLARGLSLLNIDTDVFIAGDGRSSELTVIESSGPGVVRLYKTPFFRIPEIDHAIYPKIKKKIKENGYDFVQVNEYNELACYSIARFCSKNNIPVIIYQGMYKGIPGRIRTFFQNVYNKILLPSLKRYIHTAAAKTTWSERFLKELGFENTNVIPVGIDTQPFEKSEDRDWLSELSIPSDHKVVLYVGVFEERRNIDLMLDVASTMQGRKVTFVLVGDGIIFPKIKDRKTNEGLDNVVLPGKIPQKYLPSLYEVASMFLLPSEYEIFGMVVLESMYFGTPVISSRTAGPDNIISHGSDGILIDGFKLDDWSKVVSDLLDSDGVLVGMGEAAKRNIEEKFTWEVIAKQYKKKVLLPAIQNK